MGILTTLRIELTIAGIIFRDGIKAYANARKSLHILHNAFIWSVEIGTLFMFHEWVMLHYAVPTVIFTWEWIIVQIAE